ncbi:hypothetical protein B9479_002853 [Cryptococcus floricola]|uniref:Uncharacterized protein n=1 Tax=Cryptococcus floricola TaxID=2591691 RepID=A0A5D3B2F7_9TREE|nr:hypothetical protein B9479_002853 [Cryptococcus floricola]
MSNSTSSTTTTDPTDLTEVSALLWEAMGAKGSIPVFWAALAAVFQALLVSELINKTSDYHYYFRKTDSRILRIAIAVGTTVNVVALALSCSQIYLCVYGLTEHPFTFHRDLVFIDMVIMLMGSLFNAAAGSYYALRSYRMSGKQWWVPAIFASGLVAQVVASSVAVAHGFQFPLLTVDALPRVGAWTLETKKLFKVWIAITITCDGTLFLFITFLLFRSKDSIFHQQKKLFTRLVALLYETMLPPVISLVVLGATMSEPGNPMFDYRHICTSLLPALYWNSYLHTLVGRQTVRNILDARLAADGVERLSGAGGLSSDGGRVKPRLTRSFGRVDSNGEKIRMSMLNKDRERARELMTPPLIQVDTVVTTSVSPIDTSDVYKRPSVNRGPWVDEEGRHHDGDSTISLSNDDIALSAGDVSEVKWSAA